jgi:hypothetical protein
MAHTQLGLHFMRLFRLLDHAINCIVYDAFKVDLEIYDYASSWFNHKMVLHAHISSRGMILRPSKTDIGYINVVKTYLNFDVRYREFY